MMNALRPEDPLLTAYVLGETTPEETQHVQAAIETDPLLSEAVDSAAEFSEILEDCFIPTKDYRLTSLQREKMHSEGFADETPELPKLQHRLRSSSTLNKTRLITLITPIAAVLIASIVILHHTPVESLPKSAMAQKDPPGLLLTELHIQIVSPLLQHPWPASNSNQSTELSAKRIKSEPAPLNQQLPLAPQPMQKTATHTDSLVQQSSPANSSQPSDPLPTLTDTRQETSPESIQHALITILNTDPDRFFKIMKIAAQKGDLPSAEHLPALIDNTHLSSSDTSQVPLTAGVASYPWLERFLLEKKKLPPQSAIRIEELINHLDNYHLAHQSSTGSSIVSHGLRLNTELAVCPWNEACLLVAIQITNENSSQVSTTAPRIRFRPMPEALSTYRLIGYASEAHHEKVIPPSGPNLSALSAITIPSTLAAGASTVVLYEVHPTSSKASHLFSLDLIPNTDKLASAKAPPRGAVPLASLHVHSNAHRWEAASTDYQLVSLIAASGLHLRSSEHLHDLPQEELVNTIETLLERKVLKTEQTETLMLLQQALQYR